MGVSAHVFGLNLCVPTIYISSFTPCCNSVFRLGLLIDGLGEASNFQFRRRGWERTNLPSFLSPTNPLVPKHCGGSEPFPLKALIYFGGWRGLRLNWPHFCLTSLDWLIWQKQQNLYTPETKVGWGRRDLCEAKLPHCGWYYKAAWLFLGAVWKLGHKPSDGVTLWLSNCISSIYHKEIIIDIYKRGWTFIPVLFIIAKKKCRTMMMIL